MRAIPPGIHQILPDTAATFFAAERCSMENSYDALGVDVLWADFAHSAMMFLKIQTVADSTELVAGKDQRERLRNTVEKVSRLSDDITMETMLI